MKATSNKYLADLGESIDREIEVRNYDKLAEIIKEQEKIDLEVFNKNDKALFHFSISNAYHELIANFSIEKLDDNLDKTIQNLLLAKEYSTNSNKELHCDILTNLGNLYKNIGRPFEAIDLYNQVLEINTEYGIAQGNLGSALITIGSICCEDDARVYLHKTAYRYLSFGIITSPDYASYIFKSRKKELVDFYGTDFFSQNPDKQPIYEGRSLEEKKYRKWCSENYLFLNFQNLNNSSTSKEDSLYIPYLSTKKDIRYPFTLSLFNQIKQEFVTSRYLLYDSGYNRKSHYSDRKNFQGDFGDYALNSFSTEKLKIAFRNCYSIFDRCAFLLNHYFKLGIDGTRISFTNIFIEKLQKSNKLELNKSLLKADNYALKGLIWISRDIKKTTEAKHGSVTKINLDIEKISEIRNHLEHRFLKVVEYGSYRKNEENQELEISRKELEDLTLKLFKLIRSVIFHLVVAVNIEESKKLFKQPSFQIPYQTKLDKQKI